jgi:hypothetical protein
MPKGKSARIEMASSEIRRCCNEEIPNMDKIETEPKTK